MNHLLRHLAAPLTIVASACAHAQLIDDVELRREGDDAVLAVRFVAPVQLRRSAVAESRDQAQVFYDVVATLDLPPLAASERRLAARGALPEIRLRDEGDAREGLGRRLLLQLGSAAPLQARPGAGNRTIEFVLAGLGAAVAAPPAPAAAVGAAAAPLAPAAPADAATDARAAELRARANEAEARGELDVAIDQLNLLLNLPPNAATREAQERIGHLRAKAGDAARARAEYELFLRLYPDGADADRVRASLAQLPAPAPDASAAAAGRAAPAAPEVLTTLVGSLSAFAYGGQSKVRTQEFQDSPISGLPELVSDNTLSGVDQRQLVGNVDVNWRRRDAAAEMRFVLRNAYTHDQLDSDKSRNRLSALYGEYRSLARGTSIKIGRQPATGAGVLGRFDGVALGYAFAPKWKLNAVVGSPEDKLLSTTRRFVGASVDAEALTPELGASVYGIRQTIDGVVDRKALGSELRYFKGGVSASGTLDYDLTIKGLNIASLQGTWAREDQTVVNALFDRRATPLLMLGNALFFQDPALPLARRLADLRDAGASLRALRENVKATTSYTTQGLLGFTTPVSAHWQAGADVRLTNIGQIEPVPVILPTGQGKSDNTAVGGQLIGTNLFSERDTHVIGLTALRGSNRTLGTAPITDHYRGVLASYNLSVQQGALLLEPSLRVYRQTDTQDVRTTRWSPGVRATWRVAPQWALEAEVSGERSRSTGPARNESSSRVFWFAGLRRDF